MPRIVYSLAQNESIFHQSVYGIRYLDIRVAETKSKSEPYQMVDGIWFFENTGDFKN